jgi:hypothetical protein
VHGWVHFVHGWVHFVFAASQFFQQGDMERDLGLPITPLFDRSKPGLSKSQVLLLLLQRVAALDTQSTMATWLSTLCSPRTLPCQWLVDTHSNGYTCAMHVAGCTRAVFIY